MKKQQICVENQLRKERERERESWDLEKGLWKREQSKGGRSHEEEKVRSEPLTLL